MTGKTNIASGGPDPLKVVGLVLAGTTIYAVAKRRKVSPLALVSAAVTVYMFFRE